MLEREYSRTILRMNTVSVVILTKQRPLYLENCLSSLLGQLSGDDEVIVLMDSPNMETEIILQKYTHTLPLRYYKSSIHSFPKLYNRLFKKATKQIIVSINDDCTVSNNYIDRIKRAHTQYASCVVQGVTFSLPKGNIYADIMGDNCQNWFVLNKSTRGQNRMRTIDNKNMSMPREIFVKVGLFNENLPEGSEDIEYGIRIVNLHIPILLDSTIISYHHERTTLDGFIRQHIRIARSEAAVDMVVPHKDKINIVSWRKITLHCKSAIARETLYLKERRMKDFILLPLLYILLFCIRVYWYTVKQHV